MKYPQKRTISSLAMGLLLSLTTIALAAAGSSEEALSQKILLENTIHQRVSDAVYRVLRNENFIVNVNVDMEVVPAQEYTTVYETPGEEQREYISTSNTGSTLAPPPIEIPGESEPGGPTTKKVLKKRPIKTRMSSDIPGFPGIQRPGFELYEEEVPVEAEQPVIYAEEGEAQFQEVDTTEGLIRKPYQEIPADTEVREESLEGESMAGGNAASADIRFEEPAQPVLTRHTVASTSAPSFRVKGVQMTIILEDPVSPETVENIRTVAMVASHFDRERGDELQVMTADFKGSGDKNQADAEELLLKSIAEKMTSIEARTQQQEEARKVKETEEKALRDKQLAEEKARREAELQQMREAEEQRVAQREAELKSIREAEEQRIKEREDELAAIRKAEEDRLAEERRKLFDAQQEQAQERLRQDSLRLALLTEQLSDLKDQLSAVDLEEEQKLKIELEQKRREAEKAALQEKQDALKNRLAELETQKLQAASVPETARLDSTLVYLILGAAVLLAFVIALAVLMSGRRRRLPPASEPDFAAAPTPVEPGTELEDEIAEDVVEGAGPDDEALAMVEQANTERKLRDEVNTIKKSVVSMAVSKPTSASNIIETWLKDTGTPAESPEGEEEPVASEEGEA